MCWPSLTGVSAIHGSRSIVRQRGHADRVHLQLGDVVGDFGSSFKEIADMHGEAEVGADRSRQRPARELKQCTNAGHRSAAANAILRIGNEYVDLDGSALSIHHRRNVLDRPRLVLGVVL